MKYLFTLIPPQSSYGGGAFFVKNMSEELVKNGHTIVTTLDDDLDIIVIIDPRKDNHNIYSYGEIALYKKSHPGVRVIHRINENDLKRLNQIGIEPMILETMKIADHIIFVSNWLYSHYQSRYNIDKNIHATKSVIHSGVDTLTYYPKTQFLKERGEKNDTIRVVTHHWSNNYLKGFEIYHHLDKQLDNGGILHNGKKIEFIYIGNYNYDRFIPHATKIISPTSPDKIAKILRECDVYLTATQYEPGAMHYLEAMACGLPVVYRENGGGADEICNKCGIQFIDKTDYISAILKAYDNRDKLVNNIDFYYISRERCIDEFISCYNPLRLCQPNLFDP